MALTAAEQAQLDALTKKATEDLSGEDEDSEHYIIVKGKHAKKLKEFFQSVSDDDDEDETGDEDGNPDFDSEEEETEPKAPAPKKVIKKVAKEKDSSPAGDDKPPARHRFFS